MKIGIFALAIASLVFTSCNTTVNIAKKRHSNGYHVSISSNKEIKSNVVKNEVETPEFVESIQLEKKQTNLDASQEQILNTSEKIKIKPTENSIVSKTSQKETKKLSLKEKISVTKKLKEIKNNSIPSEKGDVDFLLIVIITILIPFLGVFLHTRDITKTLICLLLTLLFILPGLIYGLLVVFDVI